MIRMKPLTWYYSSNFSAIVPVIMSNNICLTISQVSAPTTEPLNNHIQKTQVGPPLLPTLCLVSKNKAGNTMIKIAMQRESSHAAIRHSQMYTSPKCRLSQRALNDKW